MSIKTVAVRFSMAGQDYHYLTDLEVEVGEKVIVDSLSDGYVTVRVTKVFEGVQAKATKFVVNTIDDKDYLERLSKDKKRQDIIAKLEKKKKEIEQMAIYDYLANHDSEAASLLSELKSLK